MGADQILHRSERLSRGQSQRWLSVLLDTVQARDDSRYASGIERVGRYRNCSAVKTAKNSRHKLRPRRTQEQHTVAGCQDRTQPDANGPRAEIQLRVRKPGFFALALRQERIRKPVGLLNGPSSQDINESLAPDFHFRFQPGFAFGGKFCVLYNNRSVSLGSSFPEEPLTLAVVAMEPTDVSPERSPFCGLEFGPQPAGGLIPSARQ